MRSFAFVTTAILIAGTVGVWAQSSAGSPSASQSGAPAGSSQSGSASSNSGPTVPASPATNPQSSDNASPATKPAKPPAADLSPPRSDRVSVKELGGPDQGQSSSKDEDIDISPPENDARAHPQSADAVAEEAAAGGGGGSIAEFHPWNPHKAAKDVEVGNYYFNRKNYKAAEDRYREALFYKENDAEATFRLALALERMNRPGEALEQYQNYLKILPSGPHARATHEAIQLLTSSAKAGKK